MREIEQELTNNLLEIKSALTCASTSIEGVNAQDVLSLARAYNETVKTLLEVKKVSSGYDDKKKTLLPSNKEGILSISFNEIISNDEISTLEKPIDVDEVLIHDKEL